MTNFAKSSSVQSDITSLDQDISLTDEEVRILATPEHTLSSARSLDTRLETMKMSGVPEDHRHHSEDLSEVIGDQNKFRGAIDHIGVRMGLFKGQIKDTDFVERASEVKDWIRRNPGKAALHFGTVIPLIVPGLIFPPILGAAGFGASGVVAGSVAAGAQTANTAAGGAFAILQSAGMGGYGVPIVNGIIQGASAVASVSGITASALWNSKNSADKDRKPEDTINGEVIEGPVEGGQVEQNKDDIYYGRVSTDECLLPRASKL
ncbi:MAG: hypothetical protein Q9222_000769 [Ikaeria aurantiellina]